MAKAARSVQRNHFACNLTSVTPASRATSGSESPAAFFNAGIAGAASSANDPSAVAADRRTSTSGSLSAVDERVDGIRPALVDDPKVGHRDGAHSRIRVADAADEQRDDDAPIERRPLLEFPDRSQRFAPNHRVVAGERVPERPEGASSHEAQRDRGFGGQRRIRQLFGDFWIAGAASGQVLRRPSRRPSPEGLTHPDPETSDG